MTKKSMSKLKSHQFESNNRRNLLAQLHIAQKALALEEESYRALLQRVTGRESARDMTENQMRDVLAEFKRLGWKLEQHYHSALSVHPDVRKVFAIWKSLSAHLGCKGSRSGLRAFVERMTGISDPNFLTGPQAQKVIEALKAMQSRYGVIY